MDRRILWALALLLCVLAPCRAAAPPAAKPSEKIRVVELAGSPKDIGLAYGKAMCEEIQFLHDKYLKPFLGTDANRRKAIAASFLFRQQLIPEHKGEIDALADGAKLDVGETMLANCFLDVLPSLGCSTLTLPADASPDGVARFGRNLDFPALDVADKHSVVLVVRPEGRYAFVNITWPGMIGVLSGMNEHGLALANMEVPRRMRLPQAMPYIMLYRTVLEQCKTVDEAIELLKKTPRQSSNNLMLMDATGARAVVELSPESIAVRTGQPRAALISTNHQRGDDQDTAGKCRRYDALHAASARQYGKIGVDQLEAMLGTVGQGKLNLQAMIFEPSTRTLYLALGTQASQRVYEKLEPFKKAPQAGQ